MAKKGYAAGFYLGSNKVGGLNNISNPITGAALDVTVFSTTGFKEFIAGLKEGKISVKGFYESGDTNGQVAMMTAFLAGTTLTSTQKPKFLVDGTVGFTADGIITSYSVDADVAGQVNFSAEIQLTGTIAVV
jgi:predicted secreted protein